MLSKLPGGQDALIAAYDAIEKTVHDVDAYVRVGNFLYWCIWFFLCHPIVPSVSGVDSMWTAKVIMIVSSLAIFWLAFLVICKTWLS